MGIEAAGPSQHDAGAVTTWLGRPDASYGGYGRARSQGLFHRAYDYQPEAAGLGGVPIQVWATKSFTASWRRRLDRQRQPLRAELRRAAPSIWLAR